MIAEAVTILKLSKKDLSRNRLRDDIVSGRYPPGALIAERAVADALGLSRVPVREALIQLERDGLIEIRPGRGAQVRRFSSSNIESLYQFREALEGMAARLAAERMNPSALDEFRREFEAAADSNDGEFTPRLANASSALGEKFHSAVIFGSRNSMIIEASASIMDRVQVARRLSYVVVPPEPAKDAAREHLEIIDAIEERRPDSAERCMRRHISRWASIVRGGMTGDVQTGVAG